jgi:hypothetical protein
MNSCEKKETEWKIKPPFLTEKMENIFACNESTEMVNFSIHISGYAPRKLYEFQEYCCVGCEAV